jgi:hypothetical protein
MKSIGDLVRDMTALINLKERQVDALLNEIDDLKRAIESLRRHETSPQLTEKHLSKAKPRIGDAVVKILKDAEAPMHAKDIQRELVNYGLMPSVDTIRSVLNKDALRRFCALPGNKFTLADDKETK